jgi:hypothetical protein
LVGRGRDIILTYYHGISVEGIRKNHEKDEVRIAGYRCRELNPETSEYEVGVLNT